MKADPDVLRKVRRDLSITAVMYVLPVFAMAMWFLYSGQRPWIDGPTQMQSALNLLSSLHISGSVISFLANHWLTTLIIVVGIIETIFGLYGNYWDHNEKAVDVLSYVLVQSVIIPVASLLALKLCILAAPHLAGSLGWIPFWWGVAILCVGDDLTQYWYHRLHHQLPWLWRFHRTHHSSSYMGANMAYRQGMVYAFGFANVWVVAVLTFLGLGPAAIVTSAAKAIVVIASHTAIRWDLPLYRHRILHPIAWLLEHTFIMPAVHHAHHAATTDDGIGYYKGNFGNLFFFWDLTFGTAHITRQYPAHYGVSHYENDPWHSQLLWPFVKSNVPGSELSQGGPVLRDDVPLEHRMARYRR